MQALQVLGLTQSSCALHASPRHMSWLWLWPSYSFTLPLTVPLIAVPRAVQRLWQEQQLRARQMVLQQQAASAAAAASKTQREVRERLVAHAMCCCCCTQSKGSERLSLLAAGVSNDFFHADVLHTSTVGTCVLRVKAPDASAAHARVVLAALHQACFCGCLCGFCSLRGLPHARPAYPRSTKAARW